MKGISLENIKTKEKRNRKKTADKIEEEMKK